MKIFPYIYDFVSILFENKQAMKPVKKVILFGSVTTGDYDEESDIDLFIEVPSKNEIEKIETLVKKTEKRFHSISERKWELTRNSLPLSIIVGNLDDSKWKELKSELISTGMILYGKFESLPKNLKHHTLVNYSLSKLPQDKKMKFIRTLFGYKTKKNGKEYPQEGMLEKTGGGKIGPNTILIPVEKSRDIQKFFSSFSITPEMREIWMK